MEGQDIPIIAEKFVQTSSKIYIFLGWLYKKNLDTFELQIEKHYAWTFFSHFLNIESAFKKCELITALFYNDRSKLKWF